MSSDNYIENLEGKLDRARDEAITAKLDRDNLVMVLNGLLNAVRYSVDREPRALTPQLNDAFERASQAIDKLHIDKNRPSR